MMTFGSLFAGIGGFDLGLERAGMKCKWQVEIDPFCQKVLKKHWPDVPKYGDIRNVGKHNLETVDLICGGFPCQDISNVGTRLGLEGSRSGLWSEFFSIICKLRPKYVAMENVSALLVRGFGTVLRDLATIRYDAEWEVFPASAFGAPHGRNRIFLVAYPSMYGSKHENKKTVLRPSFRETFSRVGYGGSFVRCSEYQLSEVAWNNSTWEDNGGTEIVSPVVGVVDGFSNELDRLKALGNAIVPQIAEYIGKNIIEANQSLETDGQKDGHRSA